MVRYNLEHYEERRDLINSRTSFDKNILKYKVPVLVDMEEYSEIRKNVEYYISNINTRNYNIFIVEGLRAKINTRMIGNQVEFFVLFHLNLNRYMGEEIITDLKIEIIEACLNNIQTAIVCTLDEIVEVIIGDLDEKRVPDDMFEAFHRKIDVLYNEINLDFLIDKVSDKDISNISRAIKNYAPQALYSLGDCKKNDVVLGLRSQLREGETVGAYVKSDELGRIEIRKSKKYLKSHNDKYSNDHIAIKLLDLREEAIDQINKIFDLYTPKHKLLAIEVRELIRSKVSERAYNEIIRKLFTFNGVIKVTYKDDLVYRNVIKLMKAGILTRTQRSIYQLLPEYNQALCGHYHKIRGFKQINLDVQQNTSFE